MTEAFQARAELVRRAERAVDLQYYIYEGDRAGSVLAYELLRAAERGVPVRILLDDSGIGMRDVVLAELDAHRHVEVRLFNPTTQRGGLARLVEFLTRVSRLNSRMHNKILAVDGVAAIVGGRNIGDHYFGARSRVSFRDYDVLTFGAATAEAGVSFDRFWNSEHAFPVGALGRELPEARAAQLRARLERSIARAIPDYRRAPTPRSATPRPGVKRLLARREIGRVRNHELVALLAPRSLFQKARHVLGERAMRLRRKAVAREVPERELDGRPSRVHRGHRAGATQTATMVGDTVVVAMPLEAKNPDGTPPTLRGLCAVDLRNAFWPRVVRCETALGRNLGEHAQVAGRLYVAVQPDCHKEDGCSAEPFTIVGDAARFARGWSWQHGTTPHRVDRWNSH